MSVRLAVVDGTRLILRCYWGDAGDLALAGVLDGAQPWAMEGVNYDAAKAAYEAPKPNGAGFEAQLKASVFVDFASRNALAKQYPLFVLAIRDANWADVQAAIVDANSKLLLTAAQYAGIKQAALDNHLPIVLA